MRSQRNSKVNIVLCTLALLAFSTAIAATSSQSNPRSPSGHSSDKVNKLRAAQPPDEAFPTKSSAAADALRCSGKLVTLPLKYVFGEVVVAEDQRTAELGYAIEYPADIYSNVEFLELKPRSPSKFDRSWKTYGVKACMQATGEDPGTMIAIDGSITVVARKEGSICRGSSGIALLGDKNYRKFPNSKLKCK